ncbi:hypothetical protein BCV70DRAFT_202500 [Testicularia cyperi]|uniref:Probable 26S proteasome regulatory subunit p27 n=1 Tax=Testicularia cyperi TaxID=1882483 RepID=A0A317XHK3_9BASI|nr:hypothetical protein BCV70DRAFT_202500 [Testicularia cyperi]
MTTDLNVDIHDAALADVDVSSALSGPLPTTAGSARQEAMQLLQLQKQIETDISRHLSTLTSNDVEMSTPLIDPQGFPLANKDLVAIRMARQRINVLRNDNRALRDRIAKLLELAMNGQPISESSSASSSQQQQQQPPASISPLVAFARVNSVAENSPAQAAGLQSGDKILRFGNIDSTHSQGLGALAAPGVVVDGTQIRITIQRNSTTSTLFLIPSAGWGGRGLLGCHLLPI